MIRKWEKGGDAIRMRVGAAGISIKGHGFPLVPQWELGQHAVSPPWSLVFNSRSPGTVGRSQHHTFHLPSTAPPRTDGCMIFSCPAEWTSSLCGPLNRRLHGQNVQVAGRVEAAGLARVGCVGNVILSQFLFPQSKPQTTLLSSYSIKIVWLSLFQQLFYFIHFGFECLVYVQPVFYYAAGMQYRGVCAFPNQRTDTGQ